MLYAVKPNAAKSSTRDEWKNFIKGYLKHALYHLSVATSNAQHALMPTREHLRHHFTSAPETRFLESIVRGLADGQPDRHDPE